VLEELEVLEGASDAEPGDVGNGQVDEVVGPAPVAKFQASRSRPIEAADAVEEAGLAGSVGPDDGVDVALAYVQIDAVKSLQAAEAKTHIGRPQLSLSDSQRTGVQLEAVD